MSNVIHEHSLIVDSVCLVVNFKWCPIDDDIQEFVSVCLEDSDVDIELLLSEWVMEKIYASIYERRKQEAKEFYLD